MLKSVEIDRNEHKICGPKTSACNLYDFHLAYSILRFEVYKLRHVVHLQHCQVRPNDVSGRNHRKPHGLLHILEVEGHDPVVVALMQLSVCLQLLLDVSFIFDLFEVGLDALLLVNNVILVIIIIIVDGDHHGDHQDNDEAIVDQHENHKGENVTEVHDHRVA
jgi:hypothetical protein